jgi:predicted nucleic acid-binding protein
VTRLVVDASVAIKWLVPEDHSLDAIAVLDQTDEVFAPDLIWLEIGNALWKRVRRKLLTANEAGGLIRDFEALGVKIYPSKPLMDEALGIAITYDRTVYDSVYLALADEQGCRLVTADQKFHNAMARGSYSTIVVWIEDAARP